MKIRGWQKGVEGLTSLLLGPRAGEMCRWEARRERKGLMRETSSRPDRLQFINWRRVPAPAGERGSRLSQGGQSPSIEMVV